ncbi:betaine--homocysteine S-methyltransferase [Curvivirga sp.]|uniref:betaine--homocysteine S-methyltransferase n=1 Tax=Curvivirga sp. TaxID=2856848 RepID=UPI003B5C626C
MENLFTKLLNERDYLIADGAMGTSLFKRGLQTGDAPELWNVDHQDRVESVHQEYVDNGSDIVLTNSFGCNEFRLKLHNSEDRVFELNKAAAERARKVADASDRDVVVGGSMGPTGEILEPAGTLKYEEAVAAFKAQAEGLKAGGVDVLWIETMSGREESAAAVEGASSVGLPVVTTMTFDTNGKTMMGVSPEDAYEHLSHLPTQPAAIGANCGLGPTESVISLAQMQTVVDANAVIVAKANCGIPQYVNGEFIFSGTPELMGKYARMARDCGAKIIGGCCGSDGEVIKAITDSLKDYTPGEKPSEEKIIEVLGPLSNGPSPHSHGGDENEGGRRGRKRRRG